MIRSIKDKETKKVFLGEFSKKLPQAIQKIALRKLIMLDNSLSINDLQVPPSNHLEQLKGDKKGFWSIRINNQYRIIFRVNESELEYDDVEIVDYH